MAEALDTSFGFTWRDVPGHLLNNPLQLFDRQFFSDHAIDEVWLEATRRFFVWQLAAEPRQAAATVLRQPVEEAALVEIMTCFEALRFADEDLATARERFSRAWQRIGWSPRIASVIERARAAPLRTRTALHLRGGDVVSGSWGRVMHHDKYVPVLTARAALRWAIGREREAVLLVTDSAALSNVVTSGIKGVTRPADLVDGYDDLTALDRSFVDLILLSRQARLVVPHQSAFSRLASNLGDAEMVGFHEVIDSETVKSQIRRQARVRARAPGRHERPFWSRDLTWVSDTACDTLSEGRLLSIGRRAHRADPSFPAPLLRLALREALRGNADRAARYLDDAKGPSLAPAPHDDPQAAFIATSIGVGCVADLSTGALCGAACRATRVTPA